MSLTNDMLNNLEKRRSLNNDHESIFSGIEATASNRSVYNSYIIYVFLAFLLSAVTVSLLHIESRYFQSSEIHRTSEIIKIPAMHFKTPPKVLAQPPQVKITPPTVTPVPAEIPQVKKLAEESIQDQVVEQYQEAMALISQNQILSAIKELKYIVEFEPDYQDARTALATLYLQNNQVSKATQILTDGLAIEPNNLPLTLLFARALVMAGNNQAALMALKNIAAVAGNNSAYIDLLASVQESLGNYSDAVSLYRALLRQDPTNSRWLISLGTALEHTGQKDAALTVYQKANTIGQLPPDLQNYVTNRIHDLSA